MGRTQFCRICRTVDNLKYTTKELRQLNKEQLLLAQATQQGQTNDRASKKLLLTTPTLGNICQICDERIQIFHRIDEGGHESSSDIEVDVVTNVNRSLQTNFVQASPNGDHVQRIQRPETPVIVDDDDMLFNIFMKKFDQKTQLPRHQTNTFQQHQNTPMVNDFHSTYTPPQSTGGGSEGDESKVIEVLTSRESTPAPATPMPTLNPSLKSVDPQHHRIVAIIDLDDGDDEDNNIVESQKELNTAIELASKASLDEKKAESRSVPLSSPKLNISNSKTICTSEADDDEEIVFQNVENQKDTSPILKRKRQKTYDEKKLRLVACLNLVSSDSEAEDTLHSEKEKKFSTEVTLSPTSEIKKILFICKICETKFPDFQSLSVHENIHQGVKCTLCKIGFPQVKRLIHHMRRKHREYNGDALSEKPRSGKDSCMTIRLRYMHQTTFYECQLCGRIDQVFKEHKEHILDKHPNESKSLKDPIMKQLKCPVCKAKCGAQYLSLCRHLITTHEYPEYKSHLRELVHVSAFGWNASRQQEVAKTAKIFQFFKRKTFFFECKICCKIVAGYLHHLRHVNQHQKKTENMDKRVTPKETTLSSSSSQAYNLEKLCKTPNKDGLCVSKNLRKRETLTKTQTCHSNSSKNKIKQMKKIKTLGIKKPKSEICTISKFKKKYKQKIENHIKKDVSKKSEAVTKSPVKKIQLKNKCKPKEKDLKKLPICSKLNQEKFKKKTPKKQSTKGKRIELKPQVKKVKVKAPIRQIELQKYKCKYCLKKFKGYRLYNLHLIKQHRENEFYKCVKCNKAFVSNQCLEEHSKQCSQMLCTLKRQRKTSKQTLVFVDLTENSQPFSEKVPHTNDVDSDHLVDNYLWLRDLLKLNQQLKSSDSNLTSQISPKTALLNFQCCYCLHFLGNEKDLKEHKEAYHLQNPDVLLKYKPLSKQ